MILGNIFIDCMLLLAMWFFLGLGVAIDDMSEAFKEEPKNIIPTYYNNWWESLRESYTKRRNAVFFFVLTRLLCLPIEILMILFVGFLILPVAYIISLIEPLVCKHEFHKLGWREEYDKRRDVLYSMRHYHCNKCGKDVWIDGREDYIEELYPIIKDE